MPDPSWPDRGLREYSRGPFFVGLMSEYYFDEDAAERVKRFFENHLRHSKGEWAGQPFRLLDWQWDDVVKPLFGWKRKKDSTRRYRKAYIEIPKKNGKSALASGLTLYLLIGDDEPGAEVYTAAADRAQASIVFNESANMVESSPALKKHLELVRSQKRIVHHGTKSWYQALSADVPTKEGLNIHGLVFDELHVQRSRELWDTLTYGGAARRQPLQIAITTAGVYDPESIGWEQHSYAHAVLKDPESDPAFFSYIRSADSEDDWKDPAVWRKANPSLGTTIKEDDFAEACREASNEARKLNSFLRYRLNIWTQQADRWLDVEDWKLSQTDLPPIEARAGESCIAGLDLASKIDINALVLMFGSRDEGFDVYPYFWVPEEAARKRERQNQPIYNNWIRSGHLSVTAGNQADYALIRSKINAIQDLGIYIDEIAFDPWNASHMVQELQDEDGFKMIEFRQGFGSMNQPSKELEVLIKDHKIHHDGHPVLHWMVNNVAVDEDPSGNIKPSKKRSTEKIDGVIAMVMALGRAMLAEQNTPEIILL